MKRIIIALAVLALAACGQEQPTAAEKAKESTQVTVNSAEQDPKSPEKGTQVTVDSADRPDAAKPAP